MDELTYESIFAFTASYQKSLCACRVEISRCNKEGSWQMDGPVTVTPPGLDSGLPGVSSWASCAEDKRLHSISGKAGFAFQEAAFPSPPSPHRRQQAGINSLQQPLSPHPYLAPSLAPVPCPSRGEKGPGGPLLYPLSMLGYKTRTALRASITPNYSLSPLRYSGASHYFTLTFPTLALHLNICPRFSRTHFQTICPRSCASAFSWSQ